MHGYYWAALQKKFPQQLLSNLLVKVSHVNRRILIAVRSNTHASHSEDSAIIKEGPRRSSASAAKIEQFVGREVRFVLSSAVRHDGNRHVLRPLAAGRSNHLHVCIQATAILNLRQAAAAHDCRAPPPPSAFHCSSPLTFFSENLFV
jgi:hypothetical protein